MARVSLPYNLFRHISACQRLFVAELGEPISVAFVLSLGGAAVAGFNVLVARQLSPEQFGLLNLVQAVAFFGASFVSLGSSQAAPRLVSGEDTVSSVAWWDALKRVFWRAIVPTSIIGGIAAGLWYDWSLSVTAVVITLLAALGTATLGGNLLRSAARPIIGQFIVQFWRLAMAVAILLLLLLKSEAVTLESTLVLFIAMGGLALTVTVTSVRALGSHGPIDEAQWSGLRRDSRQFLWITLSLALLNYADRLVIPSVLTLEALAQYSAIWWLVGMPFKLFHSGIGFTLLPRLRRFAEPREARHLLYTHIAFVCLIAISACVSMYFLTPWLVDILYEGKYSAPRGLVAAMLFLAVLLISYAIPSSMVGAWGDRRSLASLNMFGWPAAALALAGAWLGGNTWGLIGVVIGTSLGLALRLTGAILIAQACWRKNPHDKLAGRCSS